MSYQKGWEIQVLLKKFITLLISSALFGCVVEKSVNIKIVNLHLNEYPLITFGISDERFDQRITREVNISSNVSTDSVELYDFESIFYTEASFGGSFHYKNDGKNIVYLYPEVNYRILNNRLLIEPNISQGKFVFLQKIQGLLVVSVTDKNEIVLTQPVFLDTITLEEFYMLPSGNYTSPSLNELFEGQMGTAKDFLFILSKINDEIKYLGGSLSSESLIIEGDPSYPEYTSETFQPKNDR